MGHGPGAPPEAFPRAEAAALKALELDESLAEAHTALAEFKLYYEWDWKGAEQAFQRALQLNPSLAPAHGHYAWYLLLLGHADEALVEAKRAKELDPLTPLWTAWLGWLYYWGGGQYGEAIDEARKSLELNPDFPVGLYVLGDVYAAQGMYEEAITAHQKAAAASNSWKWGLGYTYALAGRRDEARTVAAEMKEAKRRDVLGLAEIYTALGERDKALHWLEVGYEARRDWIPWIGKNPNFEPLRDDPRFQDLLRRLNLPE
jgi:tetratricopeptide (TPR) repeat protein